MNVKLDDYEVRVLINGLIQQHSIKLYLSMYNKY